MPEKRISILRLTQNISHIPDLRRRVLYNFGLLAVYRAGTFLPIPGINRHDELLSLFDTSVHAVFNIFSGSITLSRISVFALGIMPYITASIILQLAAVVAPFLKKLSRTGESGLRKLTQYAQCLAVVLAISQGFMIALFLERVGRIISGPQIVPNPGWGFRLMATLALTAGTAIIIWISRQITERGIGNGICLIIFTDIVGNLPIGISEIYWHLQLHDWSIIGIAILILIIVAVAAAAVYWERGRRKIPAQNAKAAGRQVCDGNATRLHLSANPGGVIPVICGASIVAIPSMLGAVLPFAFWEQFRPGWPLFNLLFAVGIIFFCFFYAGVIFNPMGEADSIHRCGGYAPGIRRGHEAAGDIDNIQVRLAAANAIYLVLVCLAPEFLLTGFKIHLIPWIGPLLISFLNSNDLDWIMTGLGVSFYFGIPSIIIAVGVAMDAIQQIESQSGAARVDC
jgi:preprotein translocase subunit SecY